MPKIPGELTKEQTERLVALRRQGHSIKSVAKAIGTSTTTVVRHSRKAGIGEGIARQAAGTTPSAGGDLADRISKAQKGNVGGRNRYSRRKLTGDPEADDLALIDDVIAELEAEVEAARKSSNVQAYGSLQKLLLDAVERRRKMRPPPPPLHPDEDPVNIAKRDDVMERLERFVADLEQDGEVRRIMRAHLDDLETRQLQAAGTA